MFDFDLDQVQVSNTPYGYTSVPMQLAYSGAGNMMLSGARAAGFQTEEDMLKEIYDNADFETEVGINDIVQKVMAINPEKGAELQKMLTERYVGKAQMATADLATESAKLENVMIKHGTKLSREFAMTPADGGLKVLLGQWLINNNIDTKGLHPSTFTGTLKYVYQQYQDDTTFANQLRDDLKLQIAAAKDAWIKAGALAIMEGEEAPETYSAEEAFTAPLLSDDADWKAFLAFKEKENKYRKFGQG